MEVARLGDDAGVRLNTRIHERPRADRVRLLVHDGGEEHRAMPCIAVLRKRPRGE